MELTKKVVRENNSKLRYFLHRIELVKLAKNNQSYFLSGTTFFVSVALCNFFCALQRDVPELYIQPKGTITGTTLNELFVETKF